MSYKKTEWEIKDYPIEYRNEITEIIDSKGSHIFPWEARITHWYKMTGYGHTKEEAYKELEYRFNEQKQKGQDMLRPGQKMKIRFSSTSEIDKYEELAVDFFSKVFDRDYYDIFISDQSSLHDICWTEEELNEKYKMIKSIYNIDVSDVQGG